MANAPCSRGSTAATASCGESPRSISRATRCATTSLSVSLKNCAPVGDQFVAQRLEILDDAVVDQRHRPGDVRVGVADGRRAVGRPARMGDADGPAERMRVKLRREIVELALGPPPLELAAIDGADAGRIIAAIFEPLQAVEQPLRDVRISGDPDNSAHRFR